MEAIKERFEKYSTELKHPENLQPNGLANIPMSY